MIQKVILFLFSFFIVQLAIGQINASDSTTVTGKRSHLRISLLTCGVGEEAWETFGHTGIRVIDSDRRDERRDVVYNYGMFNGFDKNFELNFMRGKLLYFIATQTFQDFIEEYIYFKRSVKEQVIVLDEKQNERMRELLEINTYPENRFYKYDFFFDNCATRIRDIIPKVFDSHFNFGAALPKDVHYTFRDIINQYFYYKHWTRTGVNILLGSKIDRVMTNSEIMFLPDYLSKGIEGATADGKSISTRQVTMLEGSARVPAGTDSPFLVTLTVAILTILGLNVKKLKLVGLIMSKILLLVTGLLGCFILCMWFGTDHQACSDNFNLLWLLPTNLLLVFTKPKGRGKYAIIGMFLIFVTVLLHILKIQAVTMFEIGPVLVSLLFVFWSIYKSSISKTVIHNA